MTAALLTSPLDVVRTRLQSDFYRQQLATPSFQTSAAPRQLPFLRLPVLHFHRTFQVLSSIYRVEGLGTLFHGLGPNLLGVVPSTAIKFYIYSNSKRLVSQKLFGGQETALAQLLAAAAADISTSTVMTPIRLLQARLLFDKSVSEKTGQIYKKNFDCILKLIRHGGIKGLYKNSRASYSGVAEFTLHLVLYEQMKILLTKSSDRNQASTWHQAVDLGGKIGAAVTSKLLAVIATYPYGVIYLILYLIDR
jgi:solute carrier family 25, member 33/36